MNRTLKTMLMMFVVLLFIGTSSFAIAESLKPSAADYYTNLDKKIYSDFNNADVNVKEYVQIKDLESVAGKLDLTEKGRYQRTFREFARKNSKKSDQYVYVFISMKDEGSSKHSKYTIIDSETNKVLVEGNGWSAAK
ncbi:hypothetical protein NYE54_09410 [Paenibacillus sp. FSL K6-1330]|uniref:hypothetical protein n=1 Tax=Paenibacillus sp. FSL K6-1330 TaxID=2975292 RepID=UPI0030DD7197